MVHSVIATQEAEITPAINFTPVYFLMSQFPTPTLQKLVLCHLDKIGIKDK